MMELNTAVAVVVAVLVIGLCDNAHSDSTESNYVELCKVKENATDSDVALWKRIKPGEPQPRIIECLEACVGEYLGLMTNNKLNVDEIMKSYAKDNANEKDRSNMKAILDECKDVTDVDRCTASSKSLKCIHDGNLKYGMKEIF